jgi:hypothetical protein
LEPSPEKAGDLNPRQEAHEATRREQGQGRENPGLCFEIPWLFLTSYKFHVGEPHPAAALTPRRKVSMNAESYVKNVVELHRTAFESSLNLLSAMQELTERTIQSACEQAPWLPKEGKALIEQWVGGMQTGRSMFQESLRKGFEQMSEAMSSQASYASSQATDLVEKMAENGREAAMTAQKMTQAAFKREHK